ncbi:uncharacterized protein [Palaemon carinicauda]|uniref:uncharacterized protein n=1 Tax=Palaemon carinicauda TaxID=392227 RepID=UPI0035B62635
MNKRINRTRKLFRRHRTDGLLLLLRELIAEAVQVANEVKREKWLQWCSKISQQTSLKAIWAWFNKVSGSKRHQTKPTHPQPHQEAMNIAQTLANRSKSTNLCPATQARQEQLRPRRNDLVRAACNEPSCTDALYTSAELEAALAKCRDTAPGADGITYSMLKHLGEPAKNSYLHIINLTHAQNIRPEPWNKQDTNPIPKPKEMNAYRPIALLSCTGKVAERMVLRRLQWAVGPLHDRLYAYTRGIGTQECLADVMATVNGKSALVVFLDLEKAYELASSDAILTSLVLKGVRGHLLAWTQKYTQNRVARVTFQGATSPYIPLENGTPQGGILSPFLFNVLIENILKEDYPEGIQIFIYADDICVVCPHIVNNKHRKMQITLDTIAASCQVFGLKINPNKTKAMAIKHSQPPPPLNLLGMPIEWVNNFTYLGVNLNFRLSPTPEITLLKHKVNSRLNALRRITSLNQGATHHILRLFYIQAVRSLVEYAAPVLTTLSPTQEKSIEVIQNNAMRTLLGAPIWTRLSLLRAETHLLPLTDRINSRNSSIIFKTFKTNRNCPLHNKLQGLISLSEDLAPPHTYAGHLITALRSNGSQTMLSTLKKDTFHPDFSEKPPWIPSPIKYHYTTLPFSKALCPPAQAFRAALDSITLTLADNVYYTDGSVDREVLAAAAAVYSPHFSDCWRISNNASTLQTELVAILKALTHSLTSQGNTTIHTDSRGALAAIRSQDIRENTLIISSIRQIAHTHAPQNRQITLNWIPSHIGILAKWYINTTSLAPHGLPKNTPRKLAVIYHRLRLGYPCSWEIINPEGRQCKYCEAVPALPLDHYLCHCPETTNLRQNLGQGVPHTAEHVTAHILKNIETLAGFLRSYPPPSPQQDLNTGSLDPACLEQGKEKIYFQAPLIVNHHTYPLGKPPRG